MAFCIGAGVVGLFFVFSFWTFSDSFAISYPYEQTAIVKLVQLGQDDLQAFTRSQQAQDLGIEPARVFSLGDARYDFYTQITNPNERWWVEFDYQFVHASGSSEQAHGFLLPQQTKPIFVLAQVFEQPVQDTELVLSQVVWHRVSAHRIPDYATWFGEHMDMSITDAKFEEVTEFVKTTYGRSSFVVMKRGNSVVGINRAQVASLGAGEEQEVVLNWFGTVPAVNVVEVIPDILLFDPGVYLDPVGVQSLDTRDQVQQR